MAKSIYCYLCKAIKERPQHGYCSACNKKKCKEWKQKPKSEIKPRTGLCQCGKERVSYSKSYCFECNAIKSKEASKKYLLNLTLEQRERKNARQRKGWLAKHGKRNVSNDPALVKAREQYKNGAKNSENRVIRHRVRSLTRAYIKAGKLLKKPCEKCFTDNNVEAHHDDYDKPMDVRWLCRKHHSEHHRLIKKG